MPNQQTPQQMRIDWPAIMNPFEASQRQERVMAQYPGAEIRESYPFGQDPHITFTMPSAPAPPTTFTPAATPQGTVTQTGIGATPDIQGFIQNLMQAQGPTAQQQVTETTRTERSPQLEAQIQAAINQQNIMRQQMTQAYGGQQRSFEDVIRALQGAYQTRAGVGAGATSTAALASGLTPVEASQLSQQALEGTMGQMYPELARLRGMQAEVPVALQQALQGVGQQYQQLLSGVMAPYQQAIAGQTSTRTGETTDVLGRQQLAGNLAMQMQQMGQQQQAGQLEAQMEQARLQQQAQQFGMGQQLQYTQLGEQARQADLSAMIQQQGMRQEMMVAQLRESGLDQRQAEEISANMGIAELQQAGMDQRTAAQIMGTLQQTTMQQRGAGERAQLGAGAQLGSAQIGAGAQLGATQMREAGAGARQQAALQSQMQQALLPYTAGVTPAEQARLQTQMGVAQLGEMGAMGRAQAGAQSQMQQLMIPYTMGATPEAKSRIEAQLEAALAAAEAKGPAAQEQTVRTIMAAALKGDESVKLDIGGGQTVSFKPATKFNALRWIGNVLSWGQPYDIRGATIERSGMPGGSAPTSTQLTPEQAAAIANALGE